MCEISLLFKLQRRESTRSALDLLRYSLVYTPTGSVLNENNMRLDAHILGEIVDRI